ncbi:MAG: thiamine pyrophosphate-dependent enzyme [Planctomycetota bacterium]|nr:thiamine pyrophosphate-dependent enzyme [Planctomycetota bacterium]
MEALQRQAQCREQAQSSTACSEILSGDQAVALGALDAGIAFASSYPGTPATDILEHLFRVIDPARTKVVWSINEKVAYESALAVSIGGLRALVAMKQVGLNVASDAFMNSCPAGVNGGLVLAVGDEPECHSSQNKQDTRWYRELAGVALLEPADSQEAYEMTRAAFEWSEEFRIPIILRLTTRTAYGCSPVRRTAPWTGTTRFAWPKMPNRFFIVPTVSRRLFKSLLERQERMAQEMESSKFTIWQECQQESHRKRAILCSGVGFALAREMAPQEWGIMKVPGEPFPEAALARFVQAHSEILVLEEGDAFLERKARLAAPKGCRIRGRLSGDLKLFGELQKVEVRAVLEGAKQPTIKLDQQELPPRLPEICKPCGYHKVFAAIKQLQNLATPSDIGCNSLGGLPPYEVMDGVWAMGSSIGVACGLAALGQERILAIIGDSTFYHSGIPPTLEAVQNGYRMTILLLDNGTAAMTGGQPVPHHTCGAASSPVRLTRLIRALGVATCKAFDPHRLGIEGIRKLIEDSFSLPGAKVLLYRSQCGLYSPGYFTGHGQSLKKLEEQVHAAAL